VTHQKFSTNDVRRMLEMAVREVGLDRWCSEHGVPARTVRECTTRGRQPSAGILDALGLETCIVRKAPANEPRTNKYVGEI